MGDPVGAARHAYQTLKADGSVLLVEPFAGRSARAETNPVGRMYYAASTFICTPNSLSQEVGLGLGAQAGEARLRERFHGSGLHAVPPGDRNTVQPHPRSPEVEAASGLIGCTQ